MVEHLLAKERVESSNLFIRLLLFYCLRDFERSLRWDDPALAITWPLQRAGVSEPLLAAKDAEAALEAAGELF